MYEAVKKELLDNTLKKYDLGQNNEYLGAEVRARERAKEMIEESFKNMRRYKKIQKSEQSLNPGK